MRDDDASEATASPQLFQRPRAPRGVDLRHHTAVSAPHAQNAGGSVLQLAGSVPIFVPRSAKLFIVSLMNTPGTGGVQSPGIDTIRTSRWALRLSREVSAMATRWRV